MTRTARPIHYLDHACLSTPLEATAQAVRNAVDRLRHPQASGTDTSVELIAASGDARVALATLLHVDARDLVLTGNTTQGLGLVAAGLEWRSGDNILMSDQEFIGAPAAWRATPVEIRPVATHDGRITVDDFRRCADGRTRAIVVSTAQEVSGYRIDSAGFAQLARDLGVWLVVDGIQEVGCVPFDLAATGIHAYAAGGHKWLRSPFGTGFLYVHPSLQESMTPRSHGYMALESPPGGWNAYLSDPSHTPFDHLPFGAGAARLDPGGLPNWIGTVALRTAVDQLLDAGPEKSWQTIRSLATRLREGLRARGLGIVGDAPARHQSGIVCFQLSGGLQAERAMLPRLAAAGVFVSLRYVSGLGGLRAAPHFDNTSDDVDALLECL